jgi:hypothetical protein
VRIGRGKPRPSTPLVLPGRHENVTVRTHDGGSIPARVVESGADSLVVAITVPTRALTPAQLERLVLEYHDERGRMRLQGTFVMDDPKDPDLIRMNEPRAVEVLQQRAFVRIQATRPVFVYSAGGANEIQSHTADISGGGFLLSGQDLLPIGEEVRFRLSITSDALPVTGTGRVVRIDPQGRRAVAFENISDLDRRRVVRFIFEAQRGERKRGLKPEDSHGS